MILFVGAVIYYCLYTSLILPSFSLITIGADSMFGCPLLDNLEALLGIVFKTTLLSAQVLTKINLLRLLKSPGFYFGLVFNFKHRWRP